MRLLGLGIKVVLELLILLPLPPSTGTTEYVKTLKSVQFDIQLPHM